MTRKLIGWVMAVVVMVAAVAWPVGVIGVWAASAPGECRGGDYWVQTSADNGPTWLTRAQDVKCVWEGASPALINPAGDCGRPAGVEPRFIVYSHNWDCDQAWCPHSLKIGGVPAWPDLKKGSAITLCTDGQLWRGQVMAQIWDAGAKQIEPQTGFKCPSGACLTLTTCAGLRANNEYNVTRISLRKAR